ncbi:MAG: TlpA family protein disulfide reductase [Candidatus Eremiobacteraeota bacterium]|nr:TlpA family protein disulfide reductase [Candidatus Eremiobacteraeota bacterium]MBC5828352.1 TlpA family protein disulfide reductase [Candidatus Eremiobacteraeota bacterium]
MNRRVLVIVLAGAALFVIGFGYGHRWTIERFLGLERVPVAIGQPLPELSFSELDGSRTKLAPRPGRVLLLNVFASWCRDCNVEMPDLVRLQNSSAGRLVDVVGIDQQEQPQVVESFMSRFNAKYPVLVDHANVTHQSMGIHVIPTSIIVDGHGVVRDKIAGRMTLDQMEALVTAASRS